MLHHALATYSTPPLFSSPTIPAVFRTCKICFRSFVNAGRSDKPLGTGNSDNHFTYELKHSTTFCIPLVSAKPKGRSKSSLHNLDNCPKSIEKHIQELQEIHSNLQLRLRLRISNCNLLRSWYVLMKVNCQNSLLKKSDLRIEDLTILQGHDLLVPSPDESVVPGGGVRNSHVQVCKAPQWESASRSVAENKDENILYV